MSNHLNTVIIGGSQAGLSVSYFLKQKNVEHVILEKSEIGARWRNRWDSFTLVTPNSMNRLPDFLSNGTTGDYLKRDEIITYLQDFAATFDPPIRLGVEVESITPNNSGFDLQTSDGPVHALRVIVATGTFQHPHVPSCSQGLPDGIVQIHSNEYRNPGQLPDGPVLVVGSGQSGTQITDELIEAGRQVYLSVSSAVRIPRRYRGRDIMEWLQLIGLFERTADQLDSPEERFAAHPHVSGKDGGRTLNLRQFGRDGATLLGKVRSISGDRIELAPDLEENLRGADDFAADVCGKIDDAIEEHGVEAPPAEQENSEVSEWSPSANPQTLSLHEEGIRSIIWATGYRFDFSWVDAPIFDDHGFPIQQKGVTEHPGLYFVGLHWLHKHKSGLLYGVAEDAEYVAKHVAGHAETSDSLHPSRSSEKLSK